MPKTKSVISLVIPVHNESANLVWHHEKIVTELGKLHHDYEIIYVNDGSRDNSLEILRQLARTDSHTHFISFSRNFGKEAATTAGLKKAVGDAVVMLDADGQHPIELIGDFVESWESGSLVVIGVRASNQKEGMVKKLGSKLFYKLSNAGSSSKMIPGSTDFRLLDRKVVNEFVKLTEHSRITRGLIDWLGFSYTTVTFHASERHAGKASYSIPKLIRLAVSAFVSQSTKPLQITGVMGALVVSVTLIVGLALAVEKYGFGDPLGLAVTGTAILALFVSFLVGIVLISNWLLALYVESIHYETLNRPLYVIEDEQ